MKRTGTRISFPSANQVWHESAAAVTSPLGKGPSSRLIHYPNLFLFRYSDGPSGTLILFQGAVGSAPALTLYGDAESNAKGPLVMNDLSRPSSSMSQCFPSEPEARLMGQKMSQTQLLIPAALGTVLCTEVLAPKKAKGKGLDGTC